MAENVHRGVSRAGLGFVSLEMGREGKHRVNRGGNQHPSNPASSELNPDQDLVLSVYLILLTRTWSFQCISQSLVCLVELLTLGWSLSLALEGWLVPGAAEGLSWLCSGTVPLCEHQGLALLLLLAAFPQSARESHHRQPQRGGNGRSDTIEMQKSLVLGW